MEGADGGVLDKNLGILGITRKMRAATSTSKT
jgi:hypothetical protein